VRRRRLIGVVTAIALALLACAAGSSSTGTKADASIATGFCHRYLDGYKRFKEQRYSIDANPDHRQALITIRQAQEATHGSLLAFPAPRRCAPTWSPSTPTGET